MVYYTCNLLQQVSSHVQHDNAIEDAAAQLKQAVQRQCGYIGFTPSLPSVFHILLKFQPSTPTEHKQNEKRIKKQIDRWPDSY